MATCGHSVPGTLLAAEQLQQRNIELVENGRKGIDLEAYVKGTGGERSLDFAGAVVRATARIEVESCEICHGTIGKYDEGWQDLKLVSHNGTTLSLTVKVFGPCVDEEWTDEDYKAEVDAYHRRGLGRLASRQRLATA